MDLIVDDDYINNIVDNYLKDQCSYIENFIEQYVSILQEVLDCGICEGKTAKALEEFKKQVESTTEVSSSSYNEMWEKISRYGKDFIEEIDVADGDLYR